jgi:DNA-directed RNA polymerase specialized sigma24 family protein
MSAKRLSGALVGEEATLQGEDDPGGAKYLSKAEIDAALAALTAKEEAILRHGADLFCFCYGFDSADDLLQEALMRAFALRRKCPRDLPFVPFLWRSMSSIADAAAKARRRSRIDVFAEPEDAEEDVGAGAQAIELRDPERLVTTQEALTRIETLFRDDVEVSVLIEELAKGLRGEELRQSLKLTDGELNTIRTRMHRKCKDLAKPWREHER